MKRLKIVSIHVYNFKGFEEATFHFEGCDAVVLGGMNGFGKTTVFDAIELLFSGKIARMVEYRALHNSSLSTSDEVLPLVNSANNDTVSVEAEVKIDDVLFLLKRTARTRDMKNPVDFTAFGGLALVDKGTERVLNDEEIYAIGLSSFINGYAFLNYLSQEGATSFLLSKDRERAKAISGLFNLEGYDRPIALIDKVLAELNIRKSTAEKRIQDIDNVLLAINQNQTQAVAYQQICESDQYWDKENPELSLERYNSFLREGGILDDLAYLCGHYMSYRQHINNIVAKEILDSANLLKELVMYVKYKDKAQLISLYAEYAEKVKKMYDSFDIIYASKLSLNLSDAIIQYINNEDLAAFDADLKSFQTMYGMADKMQKQLASLYELRDRMTDLLYRNASLISNGECPLCGAKYADTDELMKNIAVQIESTRQNISESQKLIEAQLQKVKSSMLSHIVKPLGEFFAANGITQEVASAFMAIDKTTAEKHIKTLDEKFDIQISGESEIEDTVETLRGQIQALIAEVDGTLDYHKMNLTYNAFGRNMKKECISTECIEAKRAYMISLYSQSENVRQMKVEKEKMTVLKGKISDVSRKFRSMKNELKAKRSAYLSKLLSDIKILFYIYSGRIMQDCRFGRGLFVKENSANTRILITAGMSPNDEVDALYNMSSGQLVSIAIALKLSLNKLYSNTPFLAIDDPVQTMDDLNLWGFIETMRRDFRDYFLLLSTHEYDYESLLKYKFEKWNIKTFVKDMAKTNN